MTWRLRFPASREQLAADLERLAPVSDGDLTGTAQRLAEDVRAPGRPEGEGAWLAFGQLRLTMREHYRADV